MITMAVQRKMETMIGVIVAVVVAGVLLGYVLPVGVEAIVTQDTSSWGSAESEIFDLIPIFLVLTPLLVIIGWAIWSFQT